MIKIISLLASAKLFVCTANATSLIRTHSNNALPIRSIVSQTNNLITE